MVMLYLVACNSEKIFFIFQNSRTFESRFKQKCILTRKSHQTLVDLTKMGPMESIQKIKSHLSHPSNQWALVCEIKALKVLPLVCVE
jgi:hypothetical protein